MLQFKRKIKVLDFDLENRPLSYWTPDRPTAEITAIASCWADDPDSMEVNLLGGLGTDIDMQSLDSIAMLQSFVKRYNEADMVTGHYIKKHDLPIINGALLEFNLPKLSSKLVCDTRLDMYKKGDIPATQEYLAEQLGIEAPKIHMTQVDWREANRLTTAGLEATERRVVGDVRQHMQLRIEMQRRGLLKAPSVWRP